MIPNSNEIWMIQKRRVSWPLVILYWNPAPEARTRRACWRCYRRKMQNVKIFHVWLRFLCLRRCYREPQTVNFNHISPYTVLVPSDGAIDTSLSFLLIFFQIFLWYKNEVRGRKVWSVLVKSCFIKYDRWTGRNETETFPWHDRERFKDDRQK